MKVLKSFIPLLVLFFIRDAAAMPCFYFPTEDSVLPTASYPSPAVNTVPAAVRPVTVIGGNGHGSGFNYNTSIGGVITGHSGSNNGPQVGNNVGVLG